MEYIKTTAKMRKQSRNSEPQVLIGFGEYPLKDLLKFKDTAYARDLFMAPVRAPGVHRRISICTEEEIETFKEYVAWLTIIAKKKYKDI